MALAEIDIGLIDNDNRDNYEDEEYERQILAEIAKEVGWGFIYGCLRDYQLREFISSSKGRNRLGKKIPRKPKEIILVRRRDGIWVQTNEDGTKGGIDKIAQEALNGYFPFNETSPSEFFLVQLRQLNRLALFS